MNKLLMTIKTVFIKTVLKRNVIILLASCCFLATAGIGFVVIKKAITAKSNEQEKIKNLELALAQALADVKTFSQAIAKVQATQQNNSNDKNNKNNDKEINRLKKELDLALQRVEAGKKELEELQNNSQVQEETTNTQTTTQNTSTENTEKEELEQIKEKATMCKALDACIKNKDENSEENKNIDNNLDNNKKVAQNEQQKNNNGYTGRAAGYNGSTGAKKATKQNLSSHEGRKELNDALGQAFEQRKAAIFKQEMDAAKKQIQDQVIDSAKNALGLIR